MLRAVLTVPECETVAKRHPLTYVGDKFPSVSDSPQGSPDFAIVSFAPEESREPWRPGFYRFSSDLADLNEALRNLSR
jgi:hypothetical protein